MVWIIQTTARRKDAALAEADLKVAQARAQMLESSLEGSSGQEDGGVPPRCGGFQGEILEKQRVHRAADPFDDGTDHVHRQAGG